MRRALSGLVLLALLAGCAPPPAAPPALERRGESQVWRGEYAFVPPPGWTLYDLNESDYSLAFHRNDGAYPRQSSLAYAEEPFGYARELEPRAQEFLRRFLWAARVRFEPPQLTPTALSGQPALRVEIVGHEPVKGQKVRATVLFTHRGERVVAFFVTQWRPEEEPFDPGVDQTLAAFAASFHYLRPSFYDQLQP